MNRLLGGVPAIAFALIAAAPAGRFAPITGHPYDYRITETRDYGGGALTFVLDRRLTFARQGDGWTAALAFLPVAAVPGTGPTAMFTAMYEGLAGETVIYHLSGEGEILAILDEDVVWERLLAALSRMGRGDPVQAVAAGALNASMARLAPRDRTRLLTSMLAPLTAPGDAGRPSGEDRIVTLPIRSAAGAGTLSGRETTRVVGDLLIVTTRGEGELPSGDKTGTVRLVRVRTTERASGLVRHFEEETVTTIEIDGEPRRSIARTTVDLVAKVL